MKNMLMSISTGIIYYFFALIYFSFFFFSLFEMFLLYWGWTQALMLARQVFYQLGYTHQTFGLLLFF
jgi:hypothetical protein